ncbi:MAG TPA: hypothetical protein VMV86_06840 [Methanosarcinales archaeon]|nr:hypothetical protein [Methanosarcinales archaeon]
MSFEEWWKEKAPDINRAMESTNEYIKPYFKNAYEHGKMEGLLKNMKDMPPEFSKTVDDNLWDLI